MLFDGASYHQDNAYFRMPEPEKARGTGMWIAVHDATVENGTMSVIPRSHNELLAHARDSVSNHFITCEEDAWYRQAANTAVPAVMKAGGVIFFSYNTAHSTGDNRSLHERAGLAFHVGPASLHDAKPEQPMVYPGAEGEGNQSAAQQDNEVIKILQAKSTKKESEGQGQVESFGADEAQAAAEQLELLLGTKF